jgi:GNAT superfamily N-acetyltransferase
MQIDRDILDARIARGCRCFVARADDEVVAFGWLATSTEWIGEVELEITPGESEAYVWNCATHPAHRRQGFFRAVVKGIATQARREGLERLWIGTVDIPPAKAVVDAGFVPALRFTTVWHAGIRWLRVRRAEPADLALQTAAREVLAIRGRPLRIGTSMKRAVLRRH